MFILRSLKNRIVSSFALWVSATILLLVMGCNDLSVFLPANETSNKEIDEVTLTDDGYFQIKFKQGAIKKGENYELYVQKSSEAPQSLALTADTSTSNGPITATQAEVDSSDSPEVKTKAVASFKAGDDVVVKEAIDPDSYYTFQVKKIIDQKSRPHKTKITIVKAAMQALTQVVTAPVENKIRIQWAPVSLALEYEIYNDKTGSTLIASTTNAYYDFDAKENIVPGEVWIRSKRGTFVGKDLIKAKISFSEVSLVNIELPDGVYRNGQIASFETTFSDKVYPDAESTLPIDGTGRIARYSSGSGTAKIIYQYTIADAEESFSILPLAPTLLKDQKGFYLLPVIPDDNRGTLQIDSINPTAPYSVGFSTTLSSNGTVSASFAPSTDEHFKTHNAKLCLASDCETSCTTVVTAAISPATFTGVADGVYYACVQGEDKVEHLSAWVPSVSTITAANGPARILSVTSAKADGSYGAGEVIPLTVIFTRIVSVTHSADLGLTLETGATDRTATYSGGSATDALHFQYTVQAGDNSADLQYIIGSALTLGAAGTIRDVISNDANLTLPSQGSALSLAGSKTLVIDTTAPTATSVSIAAGATLTNTALNTLTLAATGATEMYVTNTAACAAGGTWETFASSKSWTIAQSNGTATVYAKFRDLVGNESTCVSDTIVHDDSAPTGNSISIDAAASTTATTAVTLTLASTSAGEMYISNTAGCGSGGSWETYGTTKAWTLGQTNATTGVYVKFRDAALNETSCINDTIVHSNAAPTATSISIESGAATINKSIVTLNLAATEATEMYITNASSCSAGGTWQSFSSTKTWTLAPNTGFSAQVYVKYRSASLLESACISDTITVALSDAITNGTFETGTLSGWTNSLTAPKAFIVDTAQPYSGSYSIRSGTVGDNDTACFSQVVDVSSTGTDHDLSFYWSYGTEAGWDYAEFWVDATKKVAKSGYASWEKLTFAILADGPHTLKWCYSRDVSDGGYGDFVWVDDIKVNPTVPMQIATFTSFPLNTAARFTGTAPSNTPEGYIAIRSTAPVTFVPVNGTSYSVGFSQGIETLVAKGSDLYPLDTGLVNGTTYYYTIYSYTALNAYSLPFNVTVVPEATNAPYSLSASPGVDQNHLSWTVESGGAESGYLLVRNTGSAVAFVPNSGTNYNVGAVTGGTVVYKGNLKAFDDPGISGTTYHYQIWAYGAGNTYSTKSQVANATPASCTGTVRNGTCWYMGPINTSCKAVCSSHNVSYHEGKIEEIKLLNADFGQVCRDLFADMGVINSNGGQFSYGPAPNVCSQLYPGSDTRFMYIGGQTANGDFAKNDAGFACPCN